VTQAVSENRLQVAGHVARQGVAHLDGRRQVGHALRQQLAEVFARMPRTREEQGDRRAVRGHREDIRGEHAAPVGLVVPQRFAVVELDRQLQDSHVRIVVVHQRALRRVVQQLPVRHTYAAVDCIAHQLPLNGCRERNSGRLLQLLDAIRGQALPVAERGDHAGHRRVVLARACLLGQRRRFHFPAQAAAQPLEFIPLAAHGRLADQPHHLRPIFLAIEDSLLAVRASGAGSKRFVGHHDALAPRVRLGGNSTVIGPPPAALGVARRLFRAGVAVAGGQSLVGRRGFMR
jgi:hypothetical protein